MPDDSQPEASTTPADPFSAMHVGAVAMLEMFRSYRKAGASMLEATCLIAAMLVSGHATGGEAPGGQQR